MDLARYSNGGASRGPQGVVFVFVSNPKRGREEQQKRTFARKIDIYLGCFANVPMEVATCSIMSIVNISNG
jgi:hypothetical protein